MGRVWFWAFVAFIVAFIGATVLGEYAGRRVLRGEWRFAPLMFAPRLVMYAGMVAIGIGMSFQAPFVGVPFTVAAALLVGMWVRAGRAVARAARAGKDPEQRAVAIAEAAVEPLAMYGILVLIGAFLMVIGLIVAGVAERLG